MPPTAPTAPAVPRRPASTGTHALFWLGDRLLSRLPLAWKAVVVAVVVLTPLCFVLPPYLGVQDATVAFARQELLAIRYGQPLIRLIEDAAVASDGAQRSGSTTAVQADMAQVAAVDARLGLALQTGTMWTTTAQDLRHAMAAAPASAAAYATWNTAVGDAVNLLAQVGSGSNLTLDPFTQTYFEGDILISRIPLLVQNMAMVATIGFAGDRNVVVDRALAQGAAQSAASTVTADLAASKLPAPTLKQLQSLAAAAVAPGPLGAVVRANDALAVGLERSLGGLLQRRIDHSIATNDTVLVEAGAGVLLGAWFVGSLVLQVRRRSRSLVASMAALAGGDLTQTPVPEGADEFAQVSRSAAEAITRVHELLSGVVERTVTLASAAEELSSVSRMVTSVADQASQRSEAVAGTAGQISADLDVVTAGSTEMGRAIEEIAEGASKAVAVSAQAANAAGEASACLDRLGAYSEEIGTIIRVITSIAEQTNLLALNATIEASRAGAAGRGFAVVAGEVKQLAQAAGKATEDVGRRIATTQEGVHDAVDAVTHIAQVVAEINDMQGVIAAAVEEQAATTAEMARSMTAVASGTQEIAANVTALAATAGDSSAGAEQITQTASELAVVAGDLQAAVGAFRL